ncbi:hypothetical protein AaE_011139 [Aphanomyces astaci]|uniref:Secreted protein n=2 Tax=Aphanomyces astaci TaxID=112090 RepID=A0A6A4ZUY0_APHAT|nr:hypothetical protein AaE_011139 [Aphanomyces astaci]
MHVGRVIVGAFLWISSTVLAECPSCAYQSVSCGNSASIAPVCDAQGLIQSDDLFCDDLDCSCADGFVCASLRLGCPGVVQGGGRARCLSLAGMQTRYDAYRDAVLPPGPATYPHLNLSWVRFHNQDDCTSSDDCLAMQQFHACGTVLCGSAVVMWKDVNGWDEHAYRVVVEGTLTDRSAGVFDMVARWDPALRQLSCDSVTTTPLAKRYSFFQAKQMH